MREIRNLCKIKYLKCIDWELLVNTHFWIWSPVKKHIFYAWPPFLGGERQMSKPRTWKTCWQVLATLKGALVTEEYMSIYVNLF